MRILLWLAQNIKTITFLSGLILINNLLLSRTRRKKRTIQSPEHILIVGASSGVGEAIALHYAKLRGKNVSLFLTARRAPNEVCKRVNDIGAKQSMAAMTDATDPNDLLQLYSKINKEWKAVDTIILCAGVLTVQPILCFTGQATHPDRLHSASMLAPPHLENLENLSSLAISSYKANVLPAFLLISTFLPLLLKSSSPRIAVLSSIAAEIPAPTRAIYGANKAALSMLLRSLRIEIANLQLSPGHTKKIGVTIVHPASIRTGLRASALDAEVSLLSSKNEEVSSLDKEERSAMTPDYVAERTVQAIDQEQDELWLPEYYWWISKFAMAFVPGLVKRGARRKYDF